MDDQSDENLAALLPDLGLDLSPMVGKSSWADAVESEDPCSLSDSADGGTPSPVGDAIEEGEIRESLIFVVKDPLGVGTRTIDLGDLESSKSYEANGNEPTERDLVKYALKEKSGHPRGVWNELFANNRKPCPDHKLCKVGYDVPRKPDGSLDLSNGFDLGLFDETPQYLIRFPLG
ncbi:hypothetical protein Dimus_024010 [Dionaea muscipula]